MITEQGEWCYTLFGTEPSRNRLAPVMPLLPTTIRSAPDFFRHLEDRVGGIAVAGMGRDLDIEVLRDAGGTVESEVDVLARPELMGDVSGGTG